MPNAAKRLRGINTAKTHGAKRRLIGATKALMSLETAVLVDWGHRFTRSPTSDVFYTRYNEKPVLLRISDILDKEYDSFTLSIKYSLIMFWNLSLWKKMLTSLKD